MVLDFMCQDNLFSRIASNKTLPNDGKMIHIRKSYRPEPFHNIYL